MYGVLKCWLVFSQLKNPSYQLFESLINVILNKRKLNVQYNRISNIFWESPLNFSRLFCVPEIRAERFVKTN